MANTGKTITAITGIVLVVLAIALSVPAFQTTIREDTVNTFSIDEGETKSVNSADITAQDIDRGNSEATLTLIQHGDSVTHTLNVSETRTFTLNGDSHEVTLDEIPSQNTAVITVRYDQLDNWSRTSEIIWTRIPFLIALIAIVMLLGGIVMAYRGR